jgi:3-hydroxyacyl-[acyl-carrier-protein] dehydratase
MAASLPHSYPFRFVDRILDSAGPSHEGAPPASGTWQGTVLTRVSADGRAGMEESWASPLLLAEAVAQAALLLEGGDAEAGKRGFLAGIDSFEIARPPRPGESLTISVKLSARFGAVVKFEGEVRSGEEILAHGAILVRKGE